MKRERLSFRSRAECDSYEGIPFEALVKQQPRSQIAGSTPVLQEVIAHSPSDNLVRCLTILMRAPTPLNLLDPPWRLCSPSSSGCSSGYCVSAQLDG